MTEDQIRKSLCSTCVNKEWESRYTNNGHYYRDLMCFYPQHRYIFGRVTSSTQCPDYEDESSVEARVTGSL